MPAGRCGPPCAMRAPRSAAHVRTAFSFIFRFHSTQRRPPLPTCVASLPCHPAPLNYSLFAAASSAAAPNCSSSPLSAPQAVSLPPSRPQQSKITNFAFLVCPFSKLITVWVYSGSGTAVCPSLPFTVRPVPSQPPHFFFFPAAQRGSPLHFNPQPQHPHPDPWCGAGRPAVTLTRPCASLCVCLINKRPQEQCASVPVPDFALPT